MLSYLCIYFIHFFLSLKAFPFLLLSSDGHLSLNFYGLLILLQTQIDWVPFPKCLQKESNWVFSLGVHSWSSEQRLCVSQLPPQQACVKRLSEKRTRCPGIITDTTAWSVTFRERIQVFTALKEVICMFFRLVLHVAVSLLQKGYKVFECDLYN